MFSFCLFGGFFATDASTVRVGMFAYYHLESRQCGSFNMNISPRYPAKTQNAFFFFHRSITLPLLASDWPTWFCIAEFQSLDVGKIAVGIFLLQI